MIKQVPWIILFNNMIIIFIFLIVLPVVFRRALYERYRTPHTLSPPARVSTPPSESRPASETDCETPPQREESLGHSVTFPFVIYSPFPASSPSSPRPSGRSAPFCTDYNEALRRRRVHKCDFVDCTNVYTKSSHLKAHKHTHTGMLLLSFLLLYSTLCSLHNTVCILFAITFKGSTLKKSVNFAIFCRKRVFIKWVIKSQNIVGLAQL